MNIERLQHMITVLRGVPREEFDLGYWDCGTTAYAVGWGARDEKFIAEGLTIGAAGRYVSVPRYQGRHSWEAVSEFFDLPDQQARYLFSTATYEVPYPTTADVIARIEELLEEAGHDA